MAQEIKDLIAKIQAEGIKLAEDKARQIQAQAQANAEKIIADAQANAKKIIVEAGEQIAKSKLAVEASFNQAGRDFLITLKARINAMLDKLVTENIRQSLTPEELSKIILLLIKAAENKPKEEVIVTLSPADAKFLEKYFLSKLVLESKSQIVLKSSDEISAGLRISFDADKSHFDFSDKALADYICANIKPELSRILKIE
jgi:V/A-type H+-transporting ATPase subunit E